jgi:hypothetical protein
MVWISSADPFTAPAVVRDLAAQGVDEVLGGVDRDQLRIGSRPRQRFLGKMSWAGTKFHEKLKLAQRKYV